jgi:hypothetical protein
MRRYDWNKGLKPNQNLKTFGDALQYFSECIDELTLKLKDQLGTLKYMIDSSIDHRIFLGATGRTQYALSFLPYALRRYSHYNGGFRPDIYEIGKDANIPVNDPETDVGIVASGSSFRPTSVNAMKVLTEDGVKSFFLTYTTLEEARKEQKVEPKESVWDYFVQQKNYEERVIFLPMREESRKKERRKASLAPEGTKYELCTAASAYAISNYICRYHSNGNTTPKKIPIETVLENMKIFRDYLAKDLIDQCYNSRFEIADFVQDLYEFKHKNVVGFDLSEVNRDSFVNRLTHCRHLGKGKKYEKEGKSVHAIKSTDFGDIDENTLFIGISRSGDNPLTWMVLAEAMEKKAEKIYLITCHANPEIDTYTNKIVLPPIVGSYKEDTCKSEFGPLGIYAFLDSCIAQLADNMDLDEPELESFHSRYG